MATLNIRLSDDEKKQLEQAAAQKKMTVSDLLREMIKEDLSVKEEQVLYKKAILETRILTRFLIRHLNIPYDEQNQILKKAFDQAEKRVKNCT